MTEQRALQTLSRAGRLALGALVVLAVAAAHCEGTLDEETSAPVRECAVGVAGRLCLERSCAAPSWHVVDCTPEVRACAELGAVCPPVTVEVWRAEPPATPAPLETP